MGRNDVDRQAQEELHFMERQRVHAMEQLEVRRVQDVSVGRAPLCARYVLAFEAQVCAGTTSAFWMKHVRVSSETTQGLCRFLIVSMPNRTLSFAGEAREDEGTAAP